MKLGDTPSQVAQFLTSNPATLGQTYIQPNPPRNYVMQWNLSVQQQLGSNLVASLGYVGSRGIHQPFRTEDANMVLPTATPQGYLWPSPAGSGTKVNPDAGTIRALWWMSSSSYHALEAQVAGRPLRSLQLNSSFTFGKSLDNSSATIAGDAFGNSVPSLDWFDTRLSKGPSDFNIGKVFVTNAVWEAPNPSSKSLLAWPAKGWEIGGIYKLSSGLPFTPLVGGDPLGKNSSDPWDYPNLVAVWSILNSNYKANNALNYVNLNCFKFPVPSTLRGNAGRNIITGPGLSSFDFSLFKNNHITRISENFNAQFRVEIFNLPNHANFGTPSNNNQQLFDGSGNLTGAAGVLSFPTVTTSRQVQFALKLTW